MFGRYLLGVGELTLMMGAAGYGATQVRRALLPAWSGSPARLAELVLGLSLIVVVMQALGAVGLLRAVPLVATIVVAGIGAGLWSRRRDRRADGYASNAPPAPPASRPAMVVALAAAFLLALSWGVRTHYGLDHGMYGEDTTWYHLPHAATFAHDGSILGLRIGDPYLLFWLYPGNSELLHAGGIVAFGNDFLSVVLNMVWLGLALLAAWCVGRPRGAGPLSVIAVAVLLESRMFTAHANPGSAKSDIVVIALLLAAAALLMNRENRDGPVFVAGLAAGLAIGTKLNLLGPVAILTVAVIAAAGRRGWRRRARIWIPALLATSGIWYVRNLVATGNPLPMLAAGPLPHPRTFTGGFQPPFSVAHYATDTDVWRHFFFPGLQSQLGDLWPGVLAAILLSGILALIRPAGALQRGLGAVVLLSSVVYVVTPLTAFGLDGFPVGFEVNLRYVAPAMAVGLALLPALPALSGVRTRYALLAALAVLFASERPFSLLGDGGVPGALLMALLVVAVPVAFGFLAGRGVSRRGIVLGATLTAAVTVALGWPAQHEYLGDRYRDPPGIYGTNPTIAWAQGVRDRRIAVIGSRGAFSQYPLYGPDLSNHVRYLGLRGPHGAFLPIESCARWRNELNAGGYDYLVASPFLFLGRHSRFGYQVQPRLELRWTLRGTGARVLLRGGGFTVVELRKQLNPAGCSKIGALD